MSESSPSSVDSVYSSKAETKPPVPQPRHSGISSSSADVQRTEGEQPQQPVRNSAKVEQRDGSHNSVPEKSKPIRHSIKMDQDGHSSVSEETKPPVRNSSKIDQDRSGDAAPNESRPLQAVRSTGHIDHQNSNVDGHGAVLEETKPLPSRNSSHLGQISSSNSNIHSPEQSQPLPPIRNSNQHTSSNASVHGSILDESQQQETDPTDQGSANHKEGTTTSAQKSHSANSNTSSLAKSTNSKDSGQSYSANSIKSAHHNTGVYHSASVPDSLSKLSSPSHSDISQRPAGLKSRKFTRNSGSSFFSRWGSGHAHDYRRPLSYTHCSFWHLFCLFFM